MKIGISTYTVICFLLCTSNHEVKEGFVIFMIPNYEQFHIIIGRNCLPKKGIVWPRSIPFVLNEKSKC
jgi:hypothetical protein